MILILLISLPAAAQNSTEKIAADLEKQLQTAVGEEKVKALYRLASLFHNNDPKRSITYAEQALTLAEKIKYETGKAYALIYLSSANRLLGSIEKPVSLGLEALRIFKNQGDRPGTLLALLSLGGIYLSLDTYDEALKYLVEALEIIEKPGSPGGKSGILDQLAQLYINLENPQKALEYAQRAYQIAEKLGSRNLMAHYLITLGKAYRMPGQHLRALQCFYQSLDLFTGMDDAYGIAAANLNIGFSHAQLGNYSKSLEYLLESLQIAEKHNYKDFICENLYHAGNQYFKLKNYDQAEAAYKKALEIAEKIANNRNIEQNYLQLSNLYDSREDYKTAMDYYKKYVQIKDRMINEKKNRQLIVLQETYETEKRTREIETLKIKNRIQTITRNASIAGLVLALVILALLFKKYLYLFAFWKKQKYIGQYRLLKPVGAGGMSTVFKAHAIRDKNHIVAVKILKDELLARESNRKRFKQEGTIIDKLNHPNIIKVYERGESHEKLYIAMEFLEGRTLAQMIEAEGKLPMDVCIPIMKQIADALAFIHRSNIIHRDLKPENIMILENGNETNTVKLLDFGLSRMKLQSRITMTGVLVGTASYMAPEQITELHSSPASDVFNLGLVFYEMVTGKQAFTGNTFSAVERQILETGPAAPIEVRSELPEALNDLILQMLSKNPDHRPDTETVSDRLVLQFTTPVIAKSRDYVN